MTPETALEPAAPARGALRTKRNSLGASLALFDDAVYRPARPTLIPSQRPGIAFYMPAGAASGEVLFERLLPDAAEPPDAELLRCDGARVVQHRWTVVAQDGAF